jgi:hypothetical protein
MNTKRELTYKRAILYGLFTEFLLVLIQVIYLTAYTSLNPDKEMAFNSEYIRYRGFYIFQIIGFFLYTAIVFILIRKFQVKSIQKIFALILAGGVVELSFYMAVQADYEGVYFYSILDKFIAAAFGAIVYYYSTVKVDKGYHGGS